MSTARGKRQSPDNLENARRQWSRLEVRAGVKFSDILSHEKGEQDPKLALGLTGAFFSYSSSHRLLRPWAAALILKNPVQLQGSHPRYSPYL